MFGKIVENATGSLGKSFTVVGLLPALVLSLGVAAIWKGPDSVPTVLGLLDKGIDVARTSWYILVLFATSLVFYVLRGYLAHVFEELPGMVLARLRNWLVRRSLEERSRQETELDKLECAYTALDWFTKPPAAIRYIPAVIADPGPEITRQAWEKAYSTLELIDKNYPSGPPSVSAELADEIERGLLLLYVYHGRHPADPFVSKELARWHKFLGQNKASAEPTLSLVRDVCQREIAEVLSRLDGVPVPRWIKPTHFGNRLSALADYAEKRYGIDTAVLWDRVWWVLPDGDRKEVAESRVLIETLTALSSAFWLLFVISTMVLLVKWLSAAGVDLGLVTGTSALELLVFSACFAVAAYVFYRLSVAALEGLIRKIKPLVDVYRLKLLKTLGHVVTTVAEEREIFSALGNFMLQAAQLAHDRKIVMDAKPAPKEREEPDD